MSKWPIRRIISCHLDNNIPASAAEFRRAFNFLEGKAADQLQEDYALLNAASAIFTKLGIVARSEVPNDV